MFREIPTSNRLLQKKWDDKEQQIHLNKLKNAKSSFLPKRKKRCVYSSGRKTLRATSKKEKIQEERYKEIERENKILLQKMRRIMQAQGGSNLPFEKGSLNKGMRKKQLADITRANYQLLRRLQDKKSNYNVMKWEKERINSKQLAQRIGRLGSTMGELSSQSHKKSLPILKNPRETTTRLAK